MRRAVHQAYLPIVAAATRASTLHYCCNDREFAWGPVQPHDHHNHSEFAHAGGKEFVPQVLLIDAGCEWSCYASDITRTMPVGNGGKFSPEARDIYELVLEMQKVDLLHSMILKRYSYNIHSLRWTSSSLVCIGMLFNSFVTVSSLGVSKSWGSSRVPILLHLVRGMRKRPYWHLA